MAQTGGAYSLYISLRHPFYTAQAHLEQSLMCRVLVTNLRLGGACMGLGLKMQYSDLTWQAWPTVPH